MDSVRLQQIIPEEVWLIVTSNLLKDSPSDLENLANSSPFFRKLLAPKRTLFLVKKALEVVGSTVYLKSGLERLPIRDLIKYREVCSHWNSAADNAISEMLQYFEKVYGGYAIRRLIENSFNDFNRQLVNKFLNHFQETHPYGLSQPTGRSPFISRHLVIRVATTSYNNRIEAFQQPYLDGLDTLISAYGVHIQHLTIDVQRNVEFFNDSSRFRRWIMGMPNLTKLSVYSDHDWSGRRVVECNENDQTFKLEHLECLDTRNLPPSVFNLLIRQNSHVSTILMKNCKNDYDFFTFPLPNLKKLEMEYCSAQILITLGFPEVEWPLESLSLIFDNGDDIGCAAFFKVIQNKFANTLVNLELTLNAADVEVEGPVWKCFKTCRLDLPKLKKIKLDVCANLTCLDFLLPMKNSLEEISVEGGREFPLTFQNWVTRGLTVQFIGFEGNMVESNIWEIFTKLKKVEITPRWDRVNLSRSWFYSREKWMQRNICSSN